MKRKFDHVTLEFRIKLSEEEAGIVERAAVAMHLRPDQLPVLARRSLLEVCKAILDSGRMVYPLKVRLAEDADPAATFRES